MSVRDAAPAAIEALLAPASVAVAGATPDEGKPGGRCVAFLRRFGFDGPVYPINPRYEEVAGERCYPDLASIPGAVELLVLVVPAGAVPGYLRDAAAVGVRAAIVCSSGFAETGADGAALEAEVAAIAAESGMAVVGPNSLGVLDLNSRLAATFTTALQGDLPLRPGPIAFVTQSGAMGAAIFALAQTEGIPAGRFLSSGNETVLDFADLLDHLAAKDDVSVILGYIEGVDDGRRLVDAARAARARGKSVAVLKCGTSEAGREAARSHTGAMTGSAEAYDAAFRRAGILAATSPRELLDIAIAVSSAPPARGGRVGIVSMSGGAGVMIADRCGELGLEVPVLSDAARGELAEVLPAFAGKRNPVDLGGVYGDPDAVEACARIVARDPGIDAVIAFIGLSPLMAGRLEARLARVQRDAGKPVVVAWLGGPPEGVAELRRLGVAAYEDPMRAVTAVAKLRERATALGSWPPVPGEAPPLAGREGVLGEREVKALLARYGIPVVPERAVRTPAQAEAAARAFGGPVAVKGEAPGLVHKSDAGAVRLGVAPEDAAEAFVAVTRAAGAPSVLVQPMAPPGLELLVGAKHDPQFGPLVVAGLGGTVSEALEDVAVELAPVTVAEADAMLSRLRGRALLGAFRGQPARDRAAVAEVIARVAQLAIDAGPRLRELDLNPVVVYERGCLVLDGAAIVAEDGDG